MIDAYTIGITLALDNGVSEGLATIRRDLVALNGVVEGSATGLKDLTRAATHLQVGSGVAQPINRGSTAPSSALGDGSIPFPSGSLRPDPGMLALTGSSLLMVAETLLPTISLPAAQSIADVGSPLTNQPGTTSPETRSLVPAIASGTPSASQQLGQNATTGDFASAGYPAHISSASLARAAPEDGPGGGLFTTPGAPSALSAISDAVPYPSPKKKPDISITLGDDQSVPHMTSPQIAESQMDHSRNSRAAAYDASAWMPPSSVSTPLPSAAPPSTESQSTPLQGDIYVDGSRLGRWITDHLANAAELPRAAMTGFDPRMTPTWPGAPVGG
jgi:hypothetical protein